MPQLRNAFQLSIREMQTISVLWDNEMPLMASEIASINGCSINTVNSVLKKLLDRNLIEVADIVYSHTVLSRRYRPVASCEDYAVDLFVKQFREENPEIPFSLIITKLLEDGDETQNIMDLEKMIAERKQCIRREKECAFTNCAKA